MPRNQTPSFGIAPGRKPIFPSADDLMARASVTVDATKTTHDKWTMSITIDFPGNGWRVRIAFGSDAGDVLTVNGANRGFMKPSRTAEVTVGRALKPYDLHYDIQTGIVLASRTDANETAHYQNPTEALSICEKVESLPNPSAILQITQEATQIMDEQHMVTELETKT